MHEDLYTQRDQQAEKSLLLSALSMGVFAGAAYLSSVIFRSFSPLWPSVVLMLIALALHFTGKKHSKNYLISLGMNSVAIGMAFELAAYGFFSGLIYTLLPKKRSSIYIALVSAMIIGRVIWGIARYVLTFFGKSMFSVSIFIADGFIGAIPGIILQLVLIPVLVYILEKQNFTAKS